MNVISQMAHLNVRLRNKSCGFQWRLNDRQCNFDQVEEGGLSS